MDITDLILQDHHEQRRLFAILEQIPDQETAALSSVWARLAAFLEAHAKAEERFFYPELLKVGRGAADSPDAKDETRDAIKDHNEIRDAVAAVARCAVGSREWRAAIAQANKANGDHMAEEERQGLGDFRRNADLSLRQALAVRFAAFEADHINGVAAKNLDPDAYIRDPKAEQARAAQG